MLTCDKYFPKKSHKFELLMVAACVFLLVAMSIYANLSHLTLRNAVGGFSPIDYVNRLVNPENYKNNFENGVSLLRTSMMFKLYEAANNLGVGPELFQETTIVASVIFFAFALWTFARSVLPRKSYALPYLTVLFGLATGLLNHNLARFGSFAVLYSGQMYAPASIGAVLAFIFAFRRSVILSAITIGLTFCFHPVMGIFSGIICMFMILSLQEELQNKSTWLGGIIALFITGLWYVTVIYPTTNVVQLSPDKWVDWARFGNFHWFPFSLKVFGNEHGKRITPMLAIFILSLTRMKSDPLPYEIRRMWSAAVLASLLLTCAGLFVSLHPVSPMLIKLAMHRASKFVLLFSLPLALDLLLKDITSGSNLRAAIAWVCLVSPIVGPINPYISILSGSYGFPLIYALLRFGLELWPPSRKLFFIDAGLLLATFAIGMIFYLIFSGHAKWNDPAFVSGLSVLIFGTFTTVLIRLLRCGEKASNLILIFICCVFAVFGLLRKADKMVPWLGQKKSAAYLEAQLWAKKNTKPGSLFMPDQNISYGWRGYSQRASFGSVREWVHSGWLYSGSKEQFEEGMRRVRVLGIDPQDYLTQSLKNGKLSVGPEYRKLLADCKKEYYGLRGDQLLALSKQEKIDYFIFDKQNEEIPRLQSVFENEYFRICKPAIETQLEIISEYGSKQLSVN